MQRTVNGIGVDAGMIIVMDENYLKTVKHDLAQLNLGKVIKVPNGNYKVGWRIRDSWHGDINGEETLKVTSGKIIVIDPCYVIGKPDHTDWMAWLNATEYGEALNSDQAFTIYSMGGDGEYKVELNFDKP